VEGVPRRRRDESDGSGAPMALERVVEAEDENRRQYQPEKVRRPPLAEGVDGERHRPALGRGENQRLRANVASAKASKTETTASSRFMGGGRQHLYSVFTFTLRRKSELLPLCRLVHKLIVFFE